MQFSHPCGPDEYCLNKDLDVALWLDYRAFLKEPLLTDVHDFVVINSQLHDQFDLFKKKHVKMSHSLVPMSEILIYYSASQCPHLLSSKVVKKYGKVYLELHDSEVDKLVYWVDEMRERYYGMDGERIFENAAQIMFTKNQTGI